MLAELASSHLHITDNCTLLYIVLYAKLISYTVHSTVFMTVKIRVLNTIYISHGAEEKKVFLREQNMYTSNSDVRVEYSVQYSTSIVYIIVYIRVYSTL